MPRLKTVALIALAVLTVGGATTTNATPQQAAKIKQLQVQVKRQQAAINKRNTTVTFRTRERDAAIAQLGTTTAALSSNITTQVGVLDPRSLVAIIDAIGARLQALDPTLNNVAKSTLVSGADTFYAWTLSLHVGG